VYRRDDPGAGCAGLALPGRYIDSLWQKKGRFLTGYLGKFPIQNSLLVTALIHVNVPFCQESFFYGPVSYQNVLP